MMFGDVVAALVSIAASGANAETLVKLGFLHPLLALLHPGAAAEEVQLEAARALASIAGANRDHHSAFREARTTSVLLVLLTEGSPQLALAALNILKPLARDPVTKDQLREEGAFKTLVSLLQSSSCDASGAIGIAHPISQEPKEVPVSRAVMQTDVDVILKSAPCMETDTMGEVVEVAAGVVRNLAASPANQEALRSAGAVRALVSLLNLTESACRTAVASATALSNLAVGNQANKNGIRAAGGIERLVAMLHGSTDAAVASTEALGNLAVKNSANKDAIRLAGGLHLLCEQYKSARSCGLQTDGPTKRLRDKDKEKRREQERSARRAELPCERRSSPGIEKPTENQQSPVSSTKASVAIATSARALRNLVSSNGLNSAAVVAAGISLKELEAASKQQQGTQSEGVLIDRSAERTLSPTATKAAEGVMEALLNDSKDEGKRLQGLFDKASDREPSPSSGPFTSNPAAETTTKSPPGSSVSNGQPKIALQPSISGSRSPRHKAPSCARGGFHVHGRASPPPPIAVRGEMISPGADVDQAQPEAEWQMRSTAGIGLTLWARYGRA